MLPGSGEAVARRNRALRSSAVRRGRGRARARRAAVMLTAGALVVTTLSAAGTGCPEAEAAQSPSGSARAPTTWAPPATMELPSPPAADHRTAWAGGTGPPTSAWKADGTGVAGSTATPLRVEPTPEPVVLDPGPVDAAVRAVS